MTHSESLDQLLPALIAAQAEFPSIPKDGYNPHFKSRFSTLKAVQRATQPVLAAHDLTVFQFPSTVDGKPALTTWLAHKSSQFIKDTTVLSMVKADPQAQGSAITYLRRYAWSAILGLVTDEDDDDGNKATIVEPSKVSPVRAEFNRLVQAAQRAGQPKDDVESTFMKKYGKKLAPVEELLAAITETADDLTKKAAMKELAAKEVTA